MHDITMQIVRVIMLMGSMYARLVDVNVTFLLGEFKPEGKILMKIPTGFKKYYPPGILLFLKWTLYRVKNREIILETIVGYHEWTGLHMEQGGCLPVLQVGSYDWVVIQFPPKMAENWWRYGGELVTK